MNMFLNFTLKGSKKQMIGRRSFLQTNWIATDYDCILTHNSNCETVCKLIANYDSEVIDRATNILELNTLDDFGSPSIFNEQEHKDENNTKRTVELVGNLITENIENAFEYTSWFVAHKFRVCYLSEKKLIMAISAERVILTDTPIKVTLQKLFRLSIPDQDSKTQKESN
ncbi:MAG: hypothetical protein ABDH28_03465 [Brevinematia bacterium]